MTRLSLLLVVVLAGCNAPITYDLDGDGVTDDLDCAPSDPEIHPGSTEVCDDGIDNDCDGSSDCSDIKCALESYCNTFLADADEDGVNIAEGDCDDNDPQNFPGNSELCDGQDNDCDEETAAPGGESDQDGDGTLSCADCDDTDAASTTRNTDADCDGVVTALDCNDNNDDVLASADDQDCDGVLTAADCDDDDDTLLAIAQRGSAPGHPRLAEWLASQPDVAAAGADEH